MINKRIPVFCILFTVIISVGLMAGVLSEPSIVITSDEIKANAWPDMKAIIESLPGFYFVDSYNLNGPVVAYRGFSPGNNGNILWMRNGIELTDAFNGEAPYYGIDIAPVVIDKIEIWHAGEYPGAFSAVVNIVTADYSSDISASAGCFGGSNELWGGYLKGEYKIDDFRVYGLATLKNWTDIDSYEESPNTDPAYTRKRFQESQQKVLECGVGYKGFSVGFIGAMQDHEHDYLYDGGYVYGSVDDRTRWYYIFNAGYQHEFFDKLGVKISSVYRYGGREYDADLDSDADNVVYTNTGELSTGEFNHDIELSYKVSEDFDINLGFNYSKKELNEYKVSRTDIITDSLVIRDWSDLMPDTEQYGGRIGAEYRWNGLTIRAGYGRELVEYNAFYQEEWGLPYHKKQEKCFGYFNGAIYYNLMVGTVSANYSRGYTQIDSWEQLAYGSSSSDIEGFYKSDNISINYILDHYRGLSGSVCGFYRKVKTILEPTRIIGPYTSPEPENDDLEITGAELNASYKVMDNLKLSMNTICQQDEYISSSAFSIPAWACPEWQSSIGMSYKPIDFVSLSINGKYTGETESFTGQFILTYTDDGEIKFEPEIIKFSESVDADGSIRLTIPGYNKVHISLYCRNIFDNCREYPTGASFGSSIIGEKKHEREFILSAGYQF